MIESYIVLLIKLKYKDTSAEYLNSSVTIICMTFKLAE